MISQNIVQQYWNESWQMSFLQLNFEMKCAGTWQTRGMLATMSCLTPSTASFEFVEITNLSRLFVTNQNLLSNGLQSSQWQWTIKKHLCNNQVRQWNRRWGRANVEPLWRNGRRPGEQLFRRFPGAVPAQQPPDKVLHRAQPGQEVLSARSASEFC